jgi:hypothetical protein
MTAPAADNFEMHARTFSAAASALLPGLATGKYDGRTEVIDELIKNLAVVLPPAEDAGDALETYLFLNRLTAPSRVVPVGDGGFVPSTNTHYDQKTGQFV